MRNVLVIGGGAAGMMAALAAAEAGAAVTLLERNEKPGKKLYITGKGRCNATNDCTLEEFLREVPRNTKEGVVLDRCIPLGIVMDERICSGHYFSQVFAYVKDLLSDPHQLEQPM